MLRPGPAAGASSWPDEDTACTEAYGRLTTGLPAATDLGPREAAAQAATQPELGRRVFLVVQDVEVLAGVVAPWFGQPGGGIRFDLVGVDDVWTLLRRSALAAMHLSS